MKITDMLFKAAGSELQWFGPKRLQPQEVFKIESMAATYGKSLILTDFESWAEEVRGQDINYPVSVYIRLADSRMREVSAGEDRKEDHRIVEISAFVFTLTNRTPHQEDIKKFLAKYSQEEIQDAFKAYADGLDEFENKFAIKNFFRDGGGEGVILSLKQKKAADAQREIDVEVSISRGQEESRQNVERLAEKIRQEDEASEDLPF
jgi:hypothetical protein